MQRAVRKNDEGYATAEAAMALPALMVVLGLAIGVIVCVGAQLKCVDAARAAARSAARGDSSSTVTSTGRQVAPDGASVQVVHRGGEVQVTVSAQVRPTRWLPGITVHAQAVSEVEPK